ncbi:MAG: glycoside hydrolase family 130 protein [Candidatus Sumerlaeota bacterium]|nr:glycoside hydrolase family 130 protein [Candidatus Sumerlaeota bacterium]
MIFPKKDVVIRWQGNPILAPKDMPAACCAVYNSGCVKTPQGEYIMASRFESTSKRQYTWISRGRDGVHFAPDPAPMEYVCAPEEQAEFDRAIKAPPPALGTWWDPRINPLEGRYYITYAAVSPHGCRIGIAQTEDFRTARHVSFPLHIQNRNAVLFPERIAGEYWMLHRPQNQQGGGSIWIASSPDLKYWGNCRPIADAQHFWESKKIGPAAPPIRTTQGWLEVYHGVFGHSNGVNYACGAMLLDLEQPWRVVARAKAPILFVEEMYEMVGQVPNVVFPGAVVPEPDGAVKLYYGAADYVQCLATGKLDDLIAACFER